MIVLDVWSGPQSQEHVARYVEPKEQAFDRAAKELDAGNLVNLRKDIAWGAEQTFDTRVGGQA